MPATKKKVKTRVLIVDDHPMIRRGLSGLINEERDMMVCGEAGSARECLELIPATEPDIAIVDVSLDDEDGLELVKEIHLRYPQLSVLVLSMHDETYYAERALRAGASGYVMKAEAAENVTVAIRKVLSGGICISQSVADRLLRQVVPHRDHQSFSIERLTNRELQILRLLGNGAKVREIAAQLCRSTKTVESHHKNIKQKLGVKSSGELLRYAIQFSRKDG